MPGEVETEYSGSKTHPLSALRMKRVPYLNGIASKVYSGRENFMATFSRFSLSCSLMQKQGAIGRSGV